MSDAHAPGDPDPMHEGLLVPGYIFAFLIPIVGFILGVLVVSRGRRPGHGYGIMGLAIVMAVVIAVIISLTSG